MSRHDSTNQNCDKVRYQGAADVLCTCDVDDPEDVPAPSTIMRDAAPSSGGVMLSGDHAASYRELQASTRELKAAQDLFKAAEGRWRAALDRFQAEMLR